MKLSAADEAWLEHKYGPAIPKPVRPSPELSKALGLLLNQKTAKVKDKPRSVAQVSGNAPCQSLWIPNWTPTLVNELRATPKRHWALPYKRLKADKAIVAKYFAGLRVATGPRRVSLMFVLGPRRKLFDRDAPRKSINDALVACGALMGDSPKFCYEGPVSYCRALLDCQSGTLILLEDL